MNNSFVMKVWKEDFKVNDEVLLLSDGNVVFAKMIGCDLNLSDKHVGLVSRSRHYAFTLEE
ncbi:hypothetical protein RYX36_026782, partial [Vicia faba]